MYYALIDCNNFFVSCERVFNPALDGKPVAVLSNNDGCIIARSDEVKALGVPMGAPLFQYAELCRKHQVITFSSNFQLYGDMSWRVMETIRTFGEEMEIYSIDEAFLKLPQLAEQDLVLYGEAIRKRVRQWTGIPVSVGIGASKTLAKIANERARKGQGVMSLAGDKKCDEILAHLPVEDIWGVGRKLAPRFRQLGIGTALDLRGADAKMIRGSFGVMGERLVNELRGIPCYTLEPGMQPRKNITCSRSFGHSVSKLEELQEAIANYAAQACYKLRRQGSKAYGIYVYLQTKLHGANPYQSVTTCRFVLPTSDTRVVIKQAKACVKKLFQPGWQYRKTGIVLLDLVAADFIQPDLLSKKGDDDQLMQLMDGINKKNGRLFFASQGIERSWRMKCDKRSPRYTTNWGELLTVS
jgi:DNA polymerase V